MDSATPKIRRLALALALALGCESEPPAEGPIEAERAEASAPPTAKPRPKKRAPVAKRPKEELPVVAARPKKKDPLGSDPALLVEPDGGPPPRGESPDAGGAELEEEVEAEGRELELAAEELRKQNEELREREEKKGARVERPAERPAPSQPKRRKLKPASLVIVTNFAKADATVNGLPYPEYAEGQRDRGMLLVAGGPYEVRVTYDGKVKVYPDIALRPYETHYLVAELSGLNAPPAPAAPPPRTAEARPEPPAQPDQEEEGEGGKLTVYSKPQGEILIDGKEAGARAPNTVDAPEGRHEVQVRYEDGSLSEKKIVRIRKGSRIKLFFRQPSKE